ncbi:TetR family transcriptional regulator C-terminal domain-containing protein [Amaricoccus solimangrovi]|uniref:TetR family transcriptional regulator C-terminal domain-containing protein n=1 Tax=Amaricoccus solimangrovi TaxID=2589815 RepID=UPI001F325099|nr:TetR family transcriptional regulator C-terminal domain-containing protein [Amaricoccus solimangrovi]
MSRAAARANPTRIQREKTEAILAAALDAFSTQGYRGATLDQIAEAAGLSKPNLLYYFASKDEIHRALLDRLLDTWLEPLRALDPEGDPAAEIEGYVVRKLRMSRDFPRESRLFAGEVLAGAPRIADRIGGPLRALMEEKAAVIRGWSEAGLIAPVDPHHLIFSIWAATQHYADFDAQIRGILGTAGGAHFPAAEAHLVHLFRRAIAPARAGAG